MPKVIFWNIQRAGGGLVSESTDDLRDDLEAIATTHQPDFIILCEGVGDFQKKLVDNGCVPTGYSAKWVDETYGDYSKATSLRYAVFRKNTVLQSDCYLIDGKNCSRPVLLISFGNECIMALHAPSVPKSSKPQTEHMIAAYKLARKLINAFEVPIFTLPRMIFGDMNIDLRSTTRVGSFMHHVYGSPIGGFQRIDPGRGTHRNKDTHQYDTTLDWALAEPGLNPTIDLVEPPPPNKRKRVNALPTVVSYKKRALQGSSVALGSHSDDGDESDTYQPTFDNRKHPDHKPIILEW